MIVILIIMVIMILIYYDYDYNCDYGRDFDYDYDYNCDYGRDFDYDYDYDLFCRSLSNKVKSELTMSELESKERKLGKEQVQSLVELHKESITVLNNLIKKISLSSKTSEQLTNLCTDDHGTDES